MGELNKKLLEGYPDFNVRNYGYGKFSKLINDLNRLGVKTSGQNVTLEKVNPEKTSSKTVSKNK
jgi:hypothetical protein